MARIFREIVISFLFIFMSGLPVTAGWVNMGDYLQIQTDKSGISQILTPKDSNFFYVVDNNAHFRKYNFNGDSLSDKILKSDGYEFTNCSYDGLSSIFFKGIETDTAISGHMCKLTKYYFLLKHLKTDSIIINKLVTTFLQYDYSMAGIGGFLFDYNITKQIGIFQYSSGDMRNIGATGESTDGGSWFLYYGKDDSFRQILYDGFKNFAISKDYSKGLFSTYSRNTWWWDGGGNYSDRNAFYFIQMDSCKAILIQQYNVSTREPPIEPYNKYGIVPDYNKFANQDSIFAGSLDKKIYFWGYIKDSVYLKDSILLNNHPNTFIFSPKDRNLILASPNNTIDIYSLDKKSITKSIKLLDSMPCNILLLTDDKKSFIAGNASGAVKYFDVLYHIGLESPELGINETTNANFLVTVYPNPANNLINFKFEGATAGLGKIILYDIYGNTLTEIDKYINNNTLTTVDISSFTNGIYFYRILCGTNEITGKLSVIK